MSCSSWKWTSLDVLTEYGVVANQQFSKVVSKKFQTPELVNDAHNIVQLE